MKVTRVDGSRYLLNCSSDGMATTLKTSNHREKNITFPRGGEERWESWNMIMMLRQERTEFGKRIRKTYEMGEVKLKRMDMKVWRPRPDGISNTISTVTKDTMLIEYED